MFDQKSDSPLSFEQVLIAERKAICPDEHSEKRALPLSALCISGGGIRSATFALGAIQGLAEKEVLPHFDYLSTVSGGGYIGSWLTAWKQRQRGLEKIVSALMPATPLPLRADPNPIQHLREYSNYLSPKLGLFSADTWTLAATIVCNMLLNWLVLVPLLMFVLLAPRLLLSFARLGEHLVASYGQAWVREARLESLIAALSALAFAIGAFCAFRYLPGLGGVNHTETQFIKRCLLPIIGSVLLFITLESWITGGYEKLDTTLTYRELLLAIVGSGMAAWVAYALTHFRRIRGRSRLIVQFTAAVVLMGAAAASLTWLLVLKAYPRMEWEAYVSFGPPLLLLALASPVILVVGLTSNVLDDEDRVWLFRAGAWLLLFVLGWSGICCLVLMAPSWAFELPAWGVFAVALVGGAGGILTAVGGFSLRSKVQRQGRGSVGATATTVAHPTSSVVLQVAATAFVVTFLIALAILTNWLFSVTGLVPGDWTDHEQFVEDTPTRSVLIGAGLLFVFAWIMARFIDINKFSLHAMYRNRLIRAYLGASNRPEQVNRFIGFAENDDLQMCELSPELRPFHVINATLNLVSGKRLAWQQRKAEAFTVTPLHCGSSHLGYRPSDKYAGGISLGTAMTISGAAASPNMGYYSSPLVGFIMTLFNARLGAWLGNPGERGSNTWRQRGPKSAVASIVREVLGLTNEDCPYVYLSDGGHFENLGIYEMVKRGCRYILVLDGAADSHLKFGDLGNALRKIRIDTNVDIEFDASWEHQMLEQKRRWAIARIRYRDAGLGDDGFLLYVRPLVYGTEPPDIVAYQRANPEFPCESTADQFFNESQTESYRMLGLYTIREVWKSVAQAKPLSELVEHLRLETKEPGDLAVSAEAGR